MCVCVVVVSLVRDFLATLVLERFISRLHYETKIFFSSEAAISVFMPIYLTLMLSGLLLIWWADSLSITTLSNDWIKLVSNWSISKKLSIKGKQERYNHPITLKL